MKVRVFASRVAAAAALARIRAAGNAVATRAAHVGSAIASRVPATWDGTGNPPTGYTIPYGIEEEAAGKRFAVVADDAFAAGKADFTGATERLPDDWDRGADATHVGSGGK